MILNFGEFICNPTLRIRHSGHWNLVIKTEKWRIMRLIGWDISQLTNRKIPTNFLCLRYFNVIFHSAEFSCSPILRIRHSGHWESLEFIYQN